MMKQNKTPLYDTLRQFSGQDPISFHVPGHKNGSIFPEHANQQFSPVLKLDMTELSGLDDLHAPQGIIAEAERLAADLFNTEHTYFLVGGSTAGNLAMILAVCGAGEKVIVQRNSHKSIFNGLELSGAKPIFLAPEFDKQQDRHTAPKLSDLAEALEKHPDTKAVILTHPDYFGKTYAIHDMIELSHAYRVPVLVDEAHGVHFSRGNAFPESALVHGADVVVHSAHKMAPALTMGSYLHVNSSIISSSKISHYLQILQSSSPSYPLMASLDIARFFLAGLMSEEVAHIMESVQQVKVALQAPEYWDLILSDDPLKIILQTKNGISGYELAHYFEQEGIYPELATHNQVLFIHGLAEFNCLERLKKATKHVQEQLNFSPNHATIEVQSIFETHVVELELSYQEMKNYNVVQVPLAEVTGQIAAEPITPYPPGIPLLLIGERITSNKIKLIRQLIKTGANIQHLDLNNGIRCFEMKG